MHLPEGERGRERARDSGEREKNENTKIVYIRRCEIELSDSCVCVRHFTTSSVELSTRTRTNDSWNVSLLCLLFNCISFGWTERHRNHSGSLSLSLSLFSILSLSMAWWLAIVVRAVHLNRLGEHNDVLVLSPGSHMQVEQKNAL